MGVLLMIKLNELEKAQIIAIVHEGWVNYQIGTEGEYNIDATDEQINSLSYAIDNLCDKNILEVTPETQHEDWMKYKLDNGWKYGKKKNEAKKTHPDLVPFNELPKQEQLKDLNFLESFKFALRLIKGDRIFSLNDLLYTRDDLKENYKLHQCICEDARTAVFAPLFEDENKEIKVKYENLKAYPQDINLVKSAFEDGYIKFFKKEE